MFSAIKKFFVSFFQFSSHSSEAEEKIKQIAEELLVSKENEEKENLNEAENPLNSFEPQLGESRPVEYDVKIYECSQRTGTVTHLSENFGIIDGVIYFEMKNVSDTLSLKQGDEVVYSVYKVEESDLERVYKIYALKDKLWGFEDNTFEIKENDDNEPEDIAAISRELSGRVKKKIKRKLLIEPLNLWCNLDTVNATYIPVEGDWVSLEADVAINKDVVNLEGDVIEITSLKPLLSKNGIGRISFWSKSKQEGAIENHIYFSKLCCEFVYEPNLGDEVEYNAIESDQGMYKWRALKVISRGVEDELNRQRIFEEFKNLMADKEDITITPNILHKEVEINKSEDAVFEILNKGKTIKKLIGIKLQCFKNKSQIKLKSSNFTKELQIRPNELVKFDFECLGKYIGVSEEICVFEFENFLICKVVRLNVVISEKMDSLLSCNYSTVIQVKSKEKLVRDNTSGTVLHGPKPWQRPKFAPLRRKEFFEVPKKLWDIIEEESEFEEKNTIVANLEEYAPCLKTDLSSSNYVNRFHILLYLEELEIRKNFLKYNKKGVFLLRRGNFLALEILGLSDQRPSFIIGDKVILTQPWSENKHLKHIGYIHEIHQKEIFVMFHESFHHMYDESECDVVFEPNLGNLIRAHDAINRGMAKLGPKWLFPTAVNEKPNQLDFKFDDLEDSDEEEALSMDLKKFECHVDENGYVIDKDSESLKTKLTWYNKNLNQRQKMAVVNVLKGRGRPLPYIIFGPPGTGKTYTLVEVIMQIYYSVPGSRLLVTTPSNSSADLLCERLIEMGKFKPGQLVRLLSFHRSMNEKVPLNLVPYSTLVSLGDDFHGSVNQVPNKGNIRTSSLNELVGRHRITVGTCSCVGALHQMSFPTGHFTHILVDEAGQATEPDLLISASFLNVANGQIVLVGDPQQLGPVCFSKLAISYGLKISLMQRLFTFFPYKRDFACFPQTSGYDPRFVTRLNVNYRSVPEILSLPSQMFYDFELIATVSETNSLEARIIEKFNFKSEDNEKPSALIFHGTLGQNYQEADTPSWFNPHEIWQAVAYLRKFFDMGLKCDDVGIITPYLKQAQKMRLLLTALNLSVPKIGTVEDFQGQERYAIILSAVRSSSFHSSKNIFQSLGFVACPKRLNVALTRARALLVIIGNPDVLSKDPYWKTVLEYCLKRNSYTGCNLIQFSNFQNLSHRSD